MWREVRFAYTATGMLVRLTAPTPVGLDTLRETIARSRGKLERETYGFDRKCTRKDVERWLTVPAEYTRGGSREPRIMPVLRRHRASRVRP